MFDVGSRIKQLRIKNDISQKELAISCGFTQSFLADIENHNKKCSLENIEKISGLLDVSLAQFFDTSGQVLPYELSHLTAEQLEKLIDFVKSLQ